MIIALDLDGVLIHEELEVWITYFEQVTGRPFDRERFAKTHNWNEATGLTTQELSDLYVDRHLSMTTSELRPIAGAVAGVNALRRLGSCHVVRARDSRIKDHTKTLLEAHFGPFDSYEFGHTASKVDAVKSLGATVLIEDSVYQAQLAAESGVRVIFFPNLRSLEHLGQSRHPGAVYPLTAKEFSASLSMAEVGDLHARTWQEIVGICLAAQG